MAEISKDSAASAAGVWTARGPRAVEALLLARVAALADQARRDPTQLALPVRIVVPSRSLADHVGERLVTHAGRSLAGVLVQTLHGLALEVLERAGARAPESEALFPVLVRRLAAEEPLLRDRLGSLVDGYAAVEATVADLLDAGFDAGSAEAALDAFEAADASDTAREAALALARVARRCLAEMERGGIGQRALLLRAAREALVRDPDTALPARAVFVHGFADATGLRAELIEELVRHRHASVLIDEPPDPASPGNPDVGVRFTTRLLDRLLHLAPVRAVEIAAPPAIKLEFVAAVRSDAEVREVAARVREALDRGERPEQIGVVARDLTAFQASLRMHFRRLGIPFSGAMDAAGGPLARHVRALEALLREREHCRVERWLDARAPASHATDTSDLRLGLRRLGLLRLCDVAAHQAAGSDVKLPVVAGWWSDAAPENGEPMRVARRRLRADALARAVADARAIGARLARMSAGESCAVQLSELLSLAGIALGWSRPGSPLNAVYAQIEELRRELPADFPLAIDELALLVRRQLLPRVAVALGGCGGGVQVLDVTQARGRTFERLFVLGLVRDVFPRSVREDPLLPDGLREAVRVVLPDIPVKKLGYDEERFLFAELVASAPHVTLCWPLASDDGRPCSRSSFVERLQWSGAFEQASSATAVLGTDGDASSAGNARILSLQEHALRAALFGPASRLAAVLPRALRGIAREILAGEAVSSTQSLAAARLAALREANGNPFEAAPQLGPYYGFVGPRATDRDPRAARLYVTTLEAVSRCAWQAFLRRLLRLEAPPDAGGALPGIDKRLVGSTVHRVIDAVFSAGGDNAAGPPRERLADWPDDERLAELAGSVAAQVLDEEGVPLKGLARVLALRALPLVLRARELDALEPEPLRIIDAEHERGIAVTDALGHAHTLHFRADRLERSGGHERLTDYKTGRPISSKKKLEKRREDFVAAVARGEALQPVAYALSSQAGGAGRLLYLRPDLPDAAAEFRVPRGDAEFESAFEAALRPLFDVWNTGSFFPRLLTIDLEKEPDACRTCDVAQACLRGDTASRRRLAAWIEARAGDREAKLDGAERSLLNAFRMHAGVPAEAEDGQ